MNELNRTVERIDYYLSQLSNSDDETAFYGLLEAGPVAIPRIVDAYLKESSPRVKAELIRIVWNYRRPETVEFLADALNDSAPEVWKSALDGLVTIGNDKALFALRKSLSLKFSDLKKEKEFEAWVREAIEQIEDQSNAAGDAKS